MLRLLSTIRDRWRGETDGAGLALVRILVSASVLIELLRVWFNDGVRELLVQPQFHFKYPLFQWVGPPQGMMPAVFVWALIILAAMVLVGWRTRWTAALMAAGYVYWFVIDAANYSDHGYLACLLSVLVAWLPTNRWASIDAYMGREKRTLVPGWCVELVRVQLAVVYFFFALSLLNSDWLAGAPLAAWADVESDRPLAALLAGKLELVRFVAVLIPILYLAAIPALWWKWTRPASIVALAVFHVWDAWALELTVSPWLLTGLNLVFCDSARWRAWGNRSWQSVPNWSAIQMPWRLACGIGLAIDRCVSWFDDTPLLGEAKAKPRATHEPARSVAPATAFTTPAKSAVAAWLVLQCWMPMRYVTIESQPDWTDLATTFAWRGLHRDKQCDLKLSVIQPSQELRWPIEPNGEFPIPLAIFYKAERLEEMGLSEGTIKDLVSAPEATREGRFAAFKISKSEAERIVGLTKSTLKLTLSDHQHDVMSQRPQLIHQYAQRVEETLSRLLEEELYVQAELDVSLNFRPSQQLLGDTDPELSRIKTPFLLANKLSKLSNPLPALSEQIQLAKDQAERRRFELEQDYDIVSDKNKGPGEPNKLPVLSDEDERWYQEKFVKNK